MVKDVIAHKISRLKKEKKALILAHNYQRGEIQDIADYVGDSIGLCRKAMEEDAKIIVFSAVDFMAESAAILNPDKKVLLPSLGARCPMAQMLPSEEIGLWKKKYPKAPVVLYVNTLAEAKAHCDICCTSANATEIIDTLNEDTVLFGPDSNLAWHVQQETEKRVVPIPRRGFCPVHVLFLEEDTKLLKKQHPDAVVLAHPECSPEIQSLADFIGSTSQMSKYAREGSAREYIVATEVGLLHRLKRENPGKEFMPAYDGAICTNMKLNTLERVYLSLREEKHLMAVPEAVAKKGRNALEKMVSILGT
ncbi:MAG: quinolinate synthase NadA [Candidatus Bathyarchaeota archaeon]|nr:quinolinate synthase NadA [Candidatus Bathyarchaeota archaeon]MDH5779109.1 quinolinate synthase NadA [Candidatus Bathyarchaeota archaeon]